MCLIYVCLNKIHQVFVEIIRLLLGIANFKNQAIQAFSTLQNNKFMNVFRYLHLRVLQCKIEIDMSDVVKIFCLFRISNFHSFLLGICVFVGGISKAFVRSNV